MQRSNSTAAALAACGLALAACGGGGGDGGPCGGPNLAVDVSYEVNGRLVDSTTTVFLVRGQPVAAAPRAVGLPPACQGKESLSAVLRSAVPPGIAYDAATGAFTGTPTQRAVMFVELKLTVEGYSSSVKRTVEFVM